MPSLFPAVEGFLLMASTHSFRAGERVGFLQKWVGVLVGSPKLQYLTCPSSLTVWPYIRRILPGDKTKLKTKEINYFDYWTFALPSINAYIFSQMGDKSEP